MNPDTSPKARIAIVGAGVTGITCARILKEGGFEPTVFEKSRGIGGRLATRRADKGLAFDHGAQYITAQSSAFHSYLQKSVSAGAAGQWHPAVSDASSTRGNDWFVGVPAMNSLVKPAAAEMDIRLISLVSALSREESAWHLELQGETDRNTYDCVVIATPAPQAHALLASQTDLATALAGVEIAPCWSLMVSFATTATPDFDVRRSAEDDLSWIARNSSKPGRTNSDCWVAHASPEWSQRHLESDREQIAQKMIDLLADAFGAPLPEIEHASAHRWRYAMTTKPLGRPYIDNEEASLFVGGDWCLGARVECAFESGQAIAQALIARLER